MSKKEYITMAMVMTALLMCMLALAATMTWTWVLPRFAIFAPLSIWATRGMMKEDYSRILLVLGSTPVINEVLYYLFS